jgi:hypothetical protein
MRSFTIIVGLLFAFITTSTAFPSFTLLEARKGGDSDKNGTMKMKGNSTGTSIDKTCKKMAKLTALTDLAANQTKLDALVSKGKMNDTSIAALKTKAADASTQLKTLMGNSTLVGECAVVNAHKKDVKTCKEMSKLTKLAALKGNTTAQDAWVAKMEKMMKKKMGNETMGAGMDDKMMARLQEIIGNATTKLAEMQGNSTLKDMCTMLQDKGASGCKCSFEIGKGVKLLICCSASGWKQWWGGGGRAVEGRRGGT